MPRALIRLTLAATAPTPTRPLSDGPAILTPFGRWLRQQLHRNAAGQPSVTVLRLLLQPTEVALLLECGGAAPPLVLVLALVRRLRAETTRGGRAQGWLAVADQLWVGQELVVAATGEVRSGRASAIPRRGAGRVRSSTTPPARAR
ncbi:MAG: hypothetical protein ABIZ70_02130 [Gemmatimonadales bacterium]